ncbi:MAG: 4-(cytidine 5'-diphospho)-2-C-methyl-D-erythritol kinase [Clostridium sp.]|nr:4-(cytidine 5'-diphospho)-2-C-methyl-D-erythritol kinase [Clostridium sp.]
MEQLTKKAYAKLNLVLDVCYKRQDGYHELRTVMQTVSLYDELTFQKRNDRQLRLEVHAAGQDVPCDQNNLVHRAVSAVMERYEACGGMDIVLKKQIPAAAGMAGGSADAAAAILACNELYGLDMDSVTMEEIAVGIGADVPYCLNGGTVLCEGIGEIMTPLPKLSGLYFVIVKPDVSVSTAAVYDALDNTASTWHPDVDGMIRAIIKKDMSALTNCMGNVLESVTMQQYPIIEERKQELLDCGAHGVLMSGSGPTVFGIFFSKEQQNRAYETLRGMDGIGEVFTAEPVADIFG